LIKRGKKIRKKIKRWEVLIPGCHLGLVLLALKPLKCIGSS